MRDMQERTEQSWQVRIASMDRCFRDQLAAKEEQMADMEAYLCDLQRDTAWASRNAHRNAHGDAEQEKPVDDVRKEVSTVCRAYQKFRG